MTETIMFMDFLKCFVAAFGMVFLMELGDKTQLIIIVLSTRNYKPKMLALGAVTGFLVIVAIGGLIASLLSEFIPLNLISLISGIVFIILGAYQGISMLVTYIKERKNKSCEDELEIEIEDKKFLKKSKNSFLVGLLAILSMEIGDKTQIVTIMLASTSSSYFGSLTGSWFALSSLAIIGAFAGSWISKKIPKKIMDIAASTLFVVIGIVIVITSLPL
ncbi:MAG: TMEM165/GDT1 family protein [Promethearchaeota archaeon]